MAADLVLAIDQGTTSTRAILFDARGTAVASAQQEIGQHYPRPGWVEHDPEEIWASVASTVAGALARANVPAARVAAVGLTNQRETVAFWDRRDGRSLGRAIVWQDRRTTDFCRERAAEGEWLRERTGLVLDPYFSATKIRWRLHNDPDARALADAGHLAVGTVDAFLLWRLTGGNRHVTDVSNASRTLLFDIHKLSWDKELCDFFGMPESLLPEALPSAADFGATRGLGFLPDGVPIAGVAGDQQAALFGQGAHDAGEAKCTYGTGAFLLVHTGTVAVLSRHRLLTTVAAMPDATPRYALEGSVFVAGSAIQWLRDGLRLFDHAATSEHLAATSNEEEPVIFVPGFVGLGAPHWVPEAQGAIFGLTRGTSAADLARAALEGVANQVADLLDAAGRDLPAPLAELRVDGGMAANRWFLQAQADALGIPVRPAPTAEATALGAALLAGLRVGIWRDTEEIRRLLSQAESVSPDRPADERERRLARWRDAVRATVAFARPQL